MILAGLVLLGHDADMRYLQDGTPVANLSLDYNFGKKDAEGRRATQWINASLWGERAEKVVQYLTKGALLNVVLDDVHVEQFKRQDGTLGSNLRARVNSFEFAGGNKKEEGAAPAPAQPAQPEHTTEHKPQPKQPGGFEQMDDDIPF